MRHVFMKDTARTDATRESRHHQREPASGANRRMLLVIALVGTLWAVAYMILNDYQSRPPFNEEADIAYHVALGHGFRSPLDLSPEAPFSAMNAPVYPLVIATAYRLFGIGTPSSVTLLMLINAVSFGAMIAGIFFLGRLLFGTDHPGLLAAASLALHPLFLFFTRDFWDGMLSLTMFTWLVAGAAWTGILAERDREAPLGRAMGLGAGMGILALTNPTLTLSYPVLLATAFPRQLQGKRWTRALTALALFCVVLAPWTFRNYRVFGEFFYVRTGYAFNIFAGNQPGTYGWLYDQSSVVVQPVINPLERSYVLSLGERGYNDFCLERFRNLFHDDPGKFFLSFLSRTGYLLFGSPTCPPEYPFISSIRWHGINWDHLLLNAVFATLGLGGMLQARRLGFKSRAIPLLALCTAIPYLPSGVIDRYSLALRALLVFYAAALVWMFATRIRYGHWPQPACSPSTPEITHQDFQSA